jgi:hypothetical protein
MTDAQIVISLIFAVIFFVILIFNVVSYPNVKLYKKKYDELKRGVYKYQPNHSQSRYFYLYSYDINTLTFTRTDVDIIFFLDGGIKLTNNLYIHKNHWFMSLVSWYYWRKFQKLKDELVRDYEYNHHFSETFRRMSDTSRDLNVYIKKQSKLDFKFFRG